MSAFVAFYDYTDKSLEEWAESMRNSEVNSYTVTGNKATHKINGVTYIKEYLDGQVLTWEVR